MTARIETTADDSSPPPPPAWSDGPAVEVLPYGAPRPDWHAVRLTGIGGSDALAALNLSPYSTPYKLWLDKSGRLPPFEARGRMTWGNRLEPLAADWFAELHDKTLGFTGTWRHPVPLLDIEAPEVDSAGRWSLQRYVMWALCNPDRYVIGENKGVEIKTVHPSSPDAKMWRGGEIPDYPHAQAQWCCGVTGADGWYVVAVIDGCDEPIVQYAERDDDLIHDMRDAAAQLCLDHLYPDTAPPADAKPSTTDALAQAALARLTDAVTIDMPEGADKLVAQREDLKAQLKALGVELRGVENTIKAPLVEHGAEYGRIGGRTVLRLKKCDRSAYSVAATKYVELRKVKAK